MRIEGWRLALIAAVALVLIVSLTIVLFWLGLLLALAVGLVLLNVLYLPRAAARLRMPPAQLALWLLPAAAVIGWLVAGGTSGAAWGAAAWLVVIAGPRLLIAYLGRRLRVQTTRWIDARVADAIPRSGSDEGSRPARRPPAPVLTGTVEIPRSARNDTGRSDSLSN